MKRISFSYSELALIKLAFGEMIDSREVKGKITHVSFRMDLSTSFIKKFESIKDKSELLMESKESR